MARSDISWKWPRAWQKRSHAMNASKRWFKPNIIRKWIDFDGIKIRTKMTANEYKTYRKLWLKWLQKLVNKLERKA